MGRGKRKRWEGKGTGGNDRERGWREVEEGGREATTPLQ